MLQEKYSTDIGYYASKSDKYKERVNRAKLELDKLRSKLSQNQDYKQEIIKELEDQEEKIREAQN